MGVSSILEGSVQKIGNNVRITAQLIDARTDVHLWSEIYDKDISDIFAIQSEVAQNVAKELKATLTQQETDLIQKTPSTTSQLAYEFYLKGNDYWSKFNTFLALDMYSKAIQVDSLYADAYAQRAKMHAYIYWSRVRNSQGHDLLAMEDVKKGLQLNPESTEVKFVESVMDYWLYRNYDKSLIILKELKKEAPNMADLYAFTSYILRRQGKMEESIIEAKQSILLDPFNANYINNLLQTYDILHQQDNRIEYARQGLSLIPDYRSFNKHIYDSYLKKTGDLKTALIESGLKEQEVQYDVYYYTRQYNKLIEFLTEAKPIITDDQYEYYPKTYLLALIHNLSGNTSVSKIYADSAIIHLKEQLKELPDDDRFYSTLGKCYALISNYKEAIAFGEKGVDIKPIKLDAYQGVYREQDLMQIYVLTGNYDKALDKIEFLLSIPSLAAIGDLLIDPIYDNMRSLPRFQKIIENAHK
jgi:tetratricopeptide (TPR) repeat protein